MQIAKKKFCNKGLSMKKKISSETKGAKYRKIKGRLTTESEDNTGVIPFKKQSHKMIIFRPIY